MAGRTGNEGPQAWLSWQGCLVCTLCVHGPVVGCISWREALVVGRCLGSTRCSPEPTPWLHACAMFRAAYLYIHSGVQSWRAARVLAGPCELLGVPTWDHVKKKSCVWCCLPH